MKTEQNFLKRRQMLLAALLSAGLGRAFAQSSGNVSRIIVPFAAGGAPLSHRLTRHLRTL